jgi:hypothetical protein
MNMYIGEHYLAHRSVRKRHHIVFIVCSIIQMLSIAISMALHNWFSYCWWDFGLVYANSFTTFTNFNNEQTISDVNSDACQSLRILVEQNCPHFCDYLPKIEVGGIFMILFGTLSLIFYLVGILFHVWSFFKVQFKFKKIWVFLVLPSVMYITGAIIYNCSIDILGIDRPDTSRFEVKAPEAKVGLYFCWVISPASVILSVYGLKTTRAAFTDPIQNNN